MEKRLTILKSYVKTRHVYEQEFIDIRGLPAQKEFP